MIMFLKITFLITNAIIVYGVFYAAKISWNEVANDNPFSPKEEGSISRSFQSIKLGLFNFGSSFRISADKHFLHFEPQHIFRWIGCRPASIPYEKIELGKYRLFKRYRVCTIGRRKITAPAWAINLSDPNAEE